MTEHAHVLRGRLVVLEPLRLGHAAELAREIAPEDDVGRWTLHPGRSEAEVRAWVERRLAGYRAGNRDFAFLQRDPASGRAMGSTSLFDVEDRFRCGEIGWTWLAAAFRGTGANMEAKRLLLGLAFEELNLVRVQIVTDARNVRARKAIDRIGAAFEGVLRSWRHGPDGSPRDSAVYAVIAPEWPSVKRRLDELVAGSSPGA